MTGLFSERRVLLVDDHPVYREGLKTVVDSHPRLRVVAEAATVGEALARLKGSAIEIMITDLSLADGSGQDLLEKCLRVYPGLKVLIVSVSRQGSDILNALQAGAAAYLSKSASRAELLKALSEVLDGRTYLHSEVSKAVMDKMRTFRAPVHLIPDVTPREQQVLDLLCQGHSPKEIGAQLYLSLSTIKTHMRSLYRKMGVTTRTQLVLKTIGTAP